MTNDDQTSDARTPSDAVPASDAPEPTDVRAPVDATEAASGPTDATEPADATEPTDPTVRTESFASDGPAELDVSIDVGQVDVRLSDTTEVHVEIRAQQGDGSNWGNNWADGLSGVLTWLRGAAASRSGDEVPADDEPIDLAAEAVQAAEITWSNAGRRLTVHSPKTMPLRLVPLLATVRAPTNSRVTVRTGAGNVTVTGRAGQAAVRTGSGGATIERVDGDAEVTTGSGGITVGPVTGRMRVKTGSGRITLDEVGGPTDVRAGSGSVRLGVVRADLGARTGSGSVSISDARAGRLDLTTGSGELRVAVHAGVAAELDLSSGSGKARSELDVTGDPPSGPAALVIRGRTGNGDVLVTRAAAG